MPVPYENTRNSVTSPPSWYAKLKPYDVIGMDEMAALVSISNPTYSADLVSQVTTLFFDTVWAQLLEGKFVTLEGIMSLKLTARGNLPLATSTPSTDGVDVAVSASTPVRNAIRNTIQFTALPVTEKVPNIEYQEDTGSEITDYIVDGGTLLLTGQDIAFTQTNSDEGMFAYNTLEEHGEKSTNVAWNKASRVIATPILAADASANEYQIQIRTRYTESGSLRTGTYRNYIRSPLTVTIAGDYPLNCLNGV